MTDLDQLRKTLREMAPVIEQAKRTAAELAPWIAFLRRTMRELPIEGMTRLATVLRDHAFTNYPTDYEVSPDDLERIRSEKE